VASIERNEFVKDQIYSVRILTLCLVLALSSISCQKIEATLLSNKADRLHNAGKLDEAIKVYQRIIEIDPNPINHWDLGVAYLDKGDTENARRQIEKIKEHGDDKLAEQLETLLQKSGQAIQYSGKDLPGKSPLNFDKK